MQPTMKLRWLKRRCKNLPPEFNALSKNANEIVLQQWWEGSRPKEEYRSLKRGTMIHWDGKSAVDMYEAHGEWRDIEIAEEE